MQFMLHQTHRNAWSDGGIDADAGCIGDRWFLILFYWEGVLGAGVGGCSQRARPERMDRGESNIRGGWCSRARALDSGFVWTKALPSQLLGNLFKEPGHKS
jgi:hypothetical protein